MKRFTKIKFLFGGVILLWMISLTFVLYKSAYYKVLLSKIGIEQPLESRPDYWCINGWTTCLKKMNLSCDVCFFGHSQIASSDFQRYFPDQ